MMTMRHAHVEKGQFDTAMAWLRLLIVVVAVLCVAGSKAERMRIALLTVQTRDGDSAEVGRGGEDGDERVHDKYAELFVQSKKQWASYQGYDYIHTVVDRLPLTGNEHTGVDTHGMESAWMAVEVVQRHLRAYDWVCLVDMATVVVDAAVRLENAIALARRHRPQLDVVLDGNEQYRAMDGRALRTGVALFRNSFWTVRLLARLRVVLADPDWARFLLSDALVSPSTSMLDNALVYLLNSDNNAQGHVFLASLFHSWDDSLLYLPKVGLLRFDRCSIHNAKCIDALHSAVSHLLSRNQLIVYRVAPYVQHVYNIFVAIYTIFAVDRLLHILGRYFWPRRKKKLMPATLPSEDLMNEYPCVVVQLPMFNERSCCETVIDAASKLNWPQARLFIQVVDDSTDAKTRRLVDDRVALWHKRGVRISVCRRTNRHGFKAGAMNEAMNFLPFDAEYIVIFDADFLPYPDFLRKTVPYLMLHRTVAFVQTRWIYTNAKESLLTRMQEVSLNFHFNCEQEVRFRTKKFFNFNGTAGVWRLSAIVDSGGWHTDTLVEDMDLSLRAFSRGWEFIYLHDVKCLNEIPPTFDAYRGQQHRWTSGPMQVLKKAFTTVFFSTHLSFLDKVYCLWFFIRNYVHVINFLYFLVLIPLMIWIPRVTIYEWAVVHLPAAISISTILFTPGEWMRVVQYVLFENSMCLFKTGAMFCGIFNIGKARQWIVTPKFARKQLFDYSTNDLHIVIQPIVVSSDSISSPPAKPTSRLHYIRRSLQTFLGRLTKYSYVMVVDFFTETGRWIKPTIKLHYQELFFSGYLGVCAYYGFFMQQYGTALFCLLNSIAYFVVGVGYLGRSG